MSELTIMQVLLFTSVFLSTEQARKKSIVKKY